MKTKLIIILSAVFLLSSCEIIEPELSGYSNFKIKKMEGKEFDITFDVRVENENGFGMKVKKGSVDVEANNMVLATLTLSDKIKVKRKSDKTYTVPVHIKIADGAMFRILALLTSSKVDLEFDGKVKGSVLGISKTVPINEKRTIDSSLLKFLIQ
jgi:LEA14-like dessication related protein